MLLPNAALLTLLAADIFSQRQKTMVQSGAKSDDEQPFSNKDETDWRDVTRP